MSKPRKHHFLPEFYLKGFCPAAQLWVYDRENGEHRKLRPETVAIKKNFYTVEDPSGEKDHALVERGLGMVENRAAPAIRKLDAGQTLEIGERYALAMFVALLKFRTPAFERQSRDIGDMLADPVAAKSLVAPSVEAVRVQLKRLGYDGTELPRQAQEVYDQVHRHGVGYRRGPNERVRSMLENALRLAKELMPKPWAVARSPEDSSFVTADLPLAVVASEDAPNWSSFEGPGVIPPGYEAWIPLSRRTLLIIGNEALNNRYVQLEESTVRTANVMVAAQCERFFMSGDEAQLMRAARALPQEITNGWDLPGSLDLSSGHDREQVQLFRRALG